MYAVPYHQLSIMNNWGQPSFTIHYHHSPWVTHPKPRVRTVTSVAKSVPWGIGGGILEDIVVVDDGSDPPLSQELGIHGSEGIKLGNNA